LPKLKLLPCSALSTIGTGLLFTVTDVVELSALSVPSTTSPSVPANAGDGLAIVPAATAVATKPAPPAVRSHQRRGQVSAKPVLTHWQFLYCE
jgi:hypothetical protein